MRNIFIALVSAVFLLSGCKAQDPAVKAARDAEEQLTFQKAVEALNLGEFVLEADRVNGRSGRVVNVSSRTNFVSVSGEKATVQLALEGVYPGPNGMGGITVEGNTSNVKLKTDKKGNVSYSMNVMGLGISARVDINMSAGSNQCTATVTPNFSGRIVTFNGYLYTKEESNVFKGRTL